MKMFSATDRFGEKERLLENDGDARCPGLGVVSKTFSSPSRNRCPLLEAICPARILTASTFRHRSRDESLNLARVKREGHVLKRPKCSEGLRRMLEDEDRLL